MRNCVYCVADGGFSWISWKDFPKNESYAIPHFWCRCCCLWRLLLFFVSRALIFFCCHWKKPTKKLQHFRILWVAIKFAFAEKHSANHKIGAFKRRRQDEQSMHFCANKCGSFPLYSWYEPSLIIQRPCQCQWIKLSSWTRWAVEKLKPNKI